jgi:hypothetical protein
LIQKAVEVFSVNTPFERGTKNCASVTILGINDASEWEGIFKKPFGFKAD